jgi:glycosyltransferase involved in cell wall biosynthesis
MEPKVTISMPCYGRPERTKRAIQSILDQDMNGWEALIIGDCCPDFEKLIESGWLHENREEASLKGNRLAFGNRSHRNGGYGYFITNLNIQGASGEYLTFMANDDIILPHHLSTYVKAIELTGKDFCYLDSWLDPIDQVRVPTLAPSQIGHSEIIVKTELARKAPPHSPHYGHDWEFIDFLRKNGRGIYIKPSIPSYRVMHIPNFGTKDVID